jgi:ribose transport system ATP-binding protein
MGDWSPTRLVQGIPFLSDRKARRRADDMSARLGVKASSSAAAVKTLSGGNQQKVVFGRWLSRDSRILLLDEPTRGVDVGARRQIWDTAEQFAADGGSVIVVCSELAELTVCHRVVVLVEGRDVGVLQGPGVTEEEMLDVIYRQTAEGTDS